MAFVVVYDACAQYGNTVRDLLIRIARTGLVQARWTNEILDELDRALMERRGVPTDKLRRLRTLMNRACESCFVEGHETLVGSLTLPDPDDRHVLAAAVRAGAR